MFFETNDLGLFLKEESEDEKVLNMHTFSSDEDPFVNSQEILFYDYETEPHIMEFLIDYCVIASFRYVTFYDHDFTIVNQCLLM